MIFTSLNIFFTEDNLLINVPFPSLPPFFPSFLYFFAISWFPPSLLKDNLAGQIILSWQLFSLNTLKCTLPVTSVITLGKPAISLICVPFKVFCLWSQVILKISSSLVFCSLILGVSSCGFICISFYWYSVNFLIWQIFLTSVMEN